MDSYLGLRLKLTFKDGSKATGTVNSINETNQKLCLTEVKLIAKGGRDEVSFPELAVFANNIEDVEIISSQKVVTGTVSGSASGAGGNKPKKTSNTKNTTSNTSPHSNSAYTTPPANQSPHATPSVYANIAHTFPSGNARQTVPAGEFDFVANLARFDKANEFKKIQADDSIPKGDRLVAINSPQRKLGIRESVLDEKPDIKEASTPSKSNLSNNTSATTSPTMKGVTDEIMEKFKHLTVPKSKSSPLLVEEGTTSEDEDHSATDSRQIPMISGEKYEKFSSSNPQQIDSFRQIGSLNFAHHLLAELPTSKSIVLLLGVSEASAFLMETFYHLLNHGRFGGKRDVFAIFAAGAAGSEGKRIELTSSVKAARKRLLSLEKVQFTTSLSDILKIQGNVVIFDALGHDGELTSNASKGLKDWMKKITTISECDEKLIYGIESSLLRGTVNNTSAIQLVTFGISRDTILPSLPTSKSILFVDTGVSGKILEEEFGAGKGVGEDIYSDSFVTEIEY